MGFARGSHAFFRVPYFLYRIEKDPPEARAGVAHPVSDVELASRLSFFLWSSIPDEKLLDLAAAGRLRAPGVLAAQVRRMLADDRADALVENFTGQWLQLRNLEAKAVPDLLMFQDFDDNMRKGFRKETEMFFGYILRDDRSTLELLSADYTFVDEQLARHYGIPGVYGPQFRKVKLTDPNRRGLLGQGSILSMTSVATRTSPVYPREVRAEHFPRTRRRPLRRRMFPRSKKATRASQSSQDGARATGIAPEEPALCGLPSRDRSAGVCARELRFGGELARQRSRWRAARRGGHARGRNEGQRSGGAAGGHSEPARRFRDRRHRKDADLRAGPRARADDMPVVRRIVKKAAQNDYRLSSIVMGIVESAPFQMRTKLEPAETA